MSNNRLLRTMCVASRPMLTVYSTFHYIGLQSTWFIFVEGSMNVSGLVF